RERLQPRTLRCLLLGPFCLSMGGRLTLGTEHDEVDGYRQRRIGGWLDERGQAKNEQQQRKTVEEEGDGRPPRREAEALARGPAAPQLAQPVRGLDRIHGAQYGLRAASMENETCASSPSLPASEGERGPGARPIAPRSCRSYRDAPCRDRCRCRAW